jgi:hypothetical protein
MDTGANKSENIPALMIATPKARGWLLRLLSLSLSVVVALSAASQIHAQTKVDPSGTWTWTTPAGKDAPGRKSTLKLKLDREKISGGLDLPGTTRQGGETAITDAKLAGETLTFTVTRKLAGNAFLQKVSGKMSGDTIKGRVEFERDGKPESREWVARRANEKGDEQSNSRAISNSPSGRSGSGWQFPSAPKRGP